MFSASGAVRTWTGSAANGFWTNRFNWLDATAPAAGDDLVFPANTPWLNTTNSFPDGTIFASLQIEGSDYAIFGNRVALTTGVAARHAAATTNTLLLPIQLGASLSVSNATTNATLVLSGNLTLAGHLLTISGAGDVELRGVVSGNGGIRKTGTGDSRLGGPNANTYAGATTVDGGLLQIDHAAALGSTAAGTLVNNDAVLVLGPNVRVGAEPLTLNSLGTARVPPAALHALGVSNAWSGPITLLTNVTVNVDDAEYLNLNGPISGVGGLRKTGTNTLILSGGGGTANTYTGGTIAANGRLVLAKTILNAAIPGTLNVGDNLGASGPDVVQIIGVQQINNKADVNVNASGVLDLGGENEEIGSLSGLSTGRILLGTGILTAGGNDSSTAYAGMISGSGGLTKNGAGVFALSSDTDFTGPTVVNEGTLLVLGRSASAQHTVNAAGRLGGTGSIGNINVSGGALAPGNPLGVLTSSNVSLNSSADFEVALRNATDEAGHGELSVRGSANLGNAALRLSLAFAPTEGDRFTLIENDGADAITGTFAGLANGSITTVSNLQFRINYNGGSGNDVVLTLTNTALRLYAAALSGGDLDGMLEPNECNLLDVVLTNVGPDTVTGITATLETKTPGTAVAYAVSPYANIPAGGRGTNLFSFQIVTTESFVCDTNVEFRLRVSTGQDGTFSVPIVLPASGTRGAPVTFTSSSSVAISDLRTTNSLLSVSGFDQPIAKATVSCHITHPNVEQLDVALIGPDGTRVDLVTRDEVPGANYGGSCADAEQTRFDDEAPLAITAGAAPFIGTFQPVGPLAQLRGFLGTRVNGEWQLVVTDTASGATGTLECWSLALHPAVCSSGGGPCELCADRTITGFLSRDDPEQIGRLLRVRPASVCPNNKVCPQILSSSRSYRYDAYPFQNGESNACITVSLTSSCVLFCTAYLEGFNPMNICENYLADTGDSAFEGFPASCSFQVPAHARFVVVISEVFANTSCAYELKVDGGTCRPILNITQTSGQSVALDWSTSTPGYRLETTNNLRSNPASSWSSVTNRAAIYNGHYVVTNIMDSKSLYRLRQP